MFPIHLIYGFLQCEQRLVNLEGVRRNNLGCFCATIQRKLDSFVFFLSQALFFSVSSAWALHLRNLQSDIDRPMIVVAAS